MELFRDNRPGAEADVHIPMSRKIGRCMVDREAAGEAEAHWGLSWPADEPLEEGGRPLGCALLVRYEAAIPPFWGFPHFQAPPRHHVLNRPLSILFWRVSFQ